MNIIGKLYFDTVHTQDLCLIDKRRVNMHLVLFFLIDGKFYQQTIFCVKHSF